ncbi:hypothetical protein ABS642_00690 [Microbacterium sp. A8/3-1]|uniref:SGNH hydrolase-type esterase domain-containing protein n=1 Tax=Microbacterium sp. A8/3-1 TaxID=3160749 RepID=A0AAU7VY31_9MICO
MTDLFRWAGYGDADTEFGTEPTAFTPLAVYGVEDGEPCVVYSPIGSQTFFGRSPLGSPATLSVRFALKLTSYPSSSVPIVAPLTSGGTSAWRIRLSSTGTLIIDNPSNTATGTTSAIPVNTWVLVKIVASASAVAVRIYNARRGGSLIGAEIVGASTFGLVDNWRQGQAASSPIVPTYRVAHLLVTDDATWLPDPEVPDALSTPRYGIIGDSNTARMLEYLRQEMLTQGIRPRDVSVWGVGGKRIAVADLTGKTSAQNIQDAKNVLTTIDHWIVALGTNDRPQSDATVNADIDTILSAIGSGPKVTWIGLTSKGSASADDIRVNGLIQAKLAARGNAVFADWNARIRAADSGDANSPLWSAEDATHNSPLGYQTQRAPFVVEQMVDASPVTGTVAQTLPAITSAASGVIGVPVFTGAATSVLPGVSQAAAGTAAVPVFSGAASSALPPLVTALAGTVTVPVVSGEAASTLPALTTALSGTAAAPVEDGRIESVLPALISSAVGVVTRPPSRMVFTVTEHRATAPAVRPRPLSPPIWPPG